MEVWTELQAAPQTFGVEDGTWIKAGATSKEICSRHGIKKAILFLSAIWNIWTARNKFIFDGKRPPARVTARLALSYAMEMQLAASKGIPPPQQRLTPSIETRPNSSWTPPPENFYKLNTDGSFVNINAAARGIIRNYRGIWIAGFSMNIGPSTIHESELWGLRQGLFLALQIGITHLILELDSLDVVQALDLDRSPNAPGPALLLDCLALLRKFIAYQILHTPRENNRAADFLAKLGHQLSHGVTSFESARKGY